MNTDFKKLALLKTGYAKRQYTMVKKHQYLENGIVSHFGSSDCNVIFESEADIQGFNKNGCKVIVEFKSEAEHKKNYVGMHLAPAYTTCSICWSQVHTHIF